MSVCEAENHLQAVAHAVIGKGGVAVGGESGESAPVNW